MSRQRRRAAVAAVILAIAILLTGTYAWQSISQQAKNEALISVNAGGRLHDDFDGTNKDIYVENFTDPEKGGVPIFARVRLDEYMETGSDAGFNRIDASGNFLDVADRDVKVVAVGTDINKVHTWPTHKPTESLADCSMGFHDYWTWYLGGQTTFMPTFNKNKDSMKADVNGTIEGVDGKVTTLEDDDRYSDYIDYTDPDNAEKSAEAIYDADANEVDEGDLAEVGVHITKEMETHHVKLTQDGSVITMAEWLTHKTPGPYWVYDTDGWAYWAMPIQPGEATGLLLNGIEMTRKMDEDCYYAINVVAQFATANDWGEAGDGTETHPPTGFYGPDAGAPPTENAEELLRIAAGMEEVTEVRVSAGGAETVDAGGSPVAFSAQTIFKGTAVPGDAITWTVEGANSVHTEIDSTGSLTVGEAETSDKLTVVAASEKYEVSGKYTVKVNLTDLGRIAGTKAGTTQTVEVDGIEWYVLVNEENKEALLWSKDLIPSWGEGGKGAFNSSSGSAAGSNKWKGSDVEAWLNGTFKEELTYLKTKTVPASITTREQIDSEAFSTTENEVFLLSEADLFGSFNGTVAKTEDYTYNGKKLISSSNVAALMCGTLEGNAWYLLRSPRFQPDAVAMVEGANGSRQHLFCYQKNAGVRPALWVDIDA